MLKCLYFNLAFSEIKKIVSKLSYPILSPPPSVVQLVFRNRLVWYGIKTTWFFRFWENSCKGLSRKPRIKEGINYLNNVFLSVTNFNTSYKWKLQMSVTILVDVFILDVVFLQISFTYFYYNAGNMVYFFFFKSLFLNVQILRLELLSSE